MRSMDILPDNEVTEVESRYYLNPQVGLDESNKFIENLRSTQQQNNAQNNQKTPPNNPKVIKKKRQCCNND